jgi:uncharacterized protein (TIGR02246 family)
MATAPACVLDFVRAINAADVAGIADLLADDHLFIDSDGSEIRGRERMREAWLQYFRLMPVYTIDVRETFCSADVVVLVGWASGTVAMRSPGSHGNEWSVPAAWRAVVRDGRIAVWQVFVKPEPIARAMGRVREDTARTGEAV